MRKLCDNFDQILTTRYYPQTERVKGEIVMTGPVWQAVDSTGLKYQPETKRVEGDLAMTAPKYRGVDDQSKYNPQTQRVETVKEMAGPVFPGVESANKYGAPGTLEGPRSYIGSYVILALFISLITHMTTAVCAACYSLTGR